MEHTCLEFQETTNTNQPHLRFIYGNGCYSSLGRVNSNGQDISIGSNCDNVSVIHLRMMMNDDSDDDNEIFMKTLQGGPI